MKIIYLVSFTFFLGYNLNKFISFINKKLINLKKIDKEVQIEINKKLVDKDIQTDINNKKMIELLDNEKDIHDINKGIYKWTIL